MKLRKRNHFLLLEVLIALSLILLCLIPFISKAVPFFQKRFEKMEELEWQRVADLSFAEVKTYLYAEPHPIPWKDIPKRKPRKEIKPKDDYQKEGLPIPLPKMTIKIGDRSQELTRTAYICYTREKQGLHSSFRLLRVLIVLTDSKGRTHPFAYFIIAQSL